MNRTICLIILSCGVVLCSIAQSEVPNTFVTGEVASADEVNENFSVLKEGVNTNAIRISGLASFAPIAFGVVDPDGQLLSGVGNFAIEGSDGLYRISIAGEWYNGINLVVIAQPVSLGGPTASNIVPKPGRDPYGGAIELSCYDSAGRLAMSYFGFVIFKP